MSRSVVAITSSGKPPIEPENPCEACGTIGTVGRARLTDEADNEIEVHAFCLKCWPEESARYRARWEEESRMRHENWMRTGGSPTPPSIGWSLESATWHGALDMLRLVLISAESRRPTAEDLTSLANDLKKQI